MNPKDIKTLADVAKWLRHHIEWNDEASAECSIGAARVLEKSIDQARAGREHLESVLNDATDFVTLSTEDVEELGLEVQLKHLQVSVSEARTFLDANAS